MIRKCPKCLESGGLCQTLLASDNDSWCRCGWRGTDKEIITERDLGEQFVETLKTPPARPIDGKLEQELWDQGTPIVERAREVGGLDKLTSADFEYIRDELPRLERERIDRDKEKLARLALEQTRLITAEEQEALMRPNGEGLEYDFFPDDGFDRSCGKPWYDFCVVLWPWEDPDDSHYLVAVGDHLCVTPPVIPQPED